MKFIMVQFLHLEESKLRSAWTCQNCTRI